MGLAVEIQAGGLFPAVSPSPNISMDELETLERWERNHPSFLHEFEGDRPPGLGLVEGYLNAGFGRLYKDAESASQDLRQTIHPAPLGNITKTKADGTHKHRVIQDLRRNGVNDAVRLPERQVLPRGVDHARDLALLSENGHDDMSVLILDFKDAFMSIPLHSAERPYNCAVVEEFDRFEAREKGTAAPRLFPCLGPDKPRIG